MCVCGFFTIWKKGRPCAWKNSCNLAHEFNESYCIRDWETCIFRITREQHHCHPASESHQPMTPTICWCDHAIPIYSIAGINSWFDHRQHGASCLHSAWGDSGRMISFRPFTRRCECKGTLMKSRACSRMCIQAGPKPTWREQTPEASNSWVLKEWIEGVIKERPNWLLHFGHFC